MRGYWSFDRAVGLLWLAAFLGSATVAPARAGEVELPRLKGPDGRVVDLAPPRGGVTALVFYSPECPISNAYSPTLSRLVGEFPAGSLKLVGICVDPDLAEADVAAHARDFGLKFPVVHDRHGRVARRVGATVTPEAF